MVLKKNAKVFDHDPVAELLDEDFIAKVIWECLKNNDPEGVLDAIETHLFYVNKAKAMENVDLPKTTMYHALRSKNPTLKTLSKLVNCIV